MTLVYHNVLVYVYYMHAPCPTNATPQLSSHLAAKQCLTLSELSHVHCTVN